MMLDNWQKWLEESGFKLVYQGGHHDVYCDGQRHLRTTGGTLGHSVHLNTRWPMFRCDCDKWKRVAYAVERPKP